MSGGGAGPQQIRAKFDFTSYSPAIPVDRDLGMRVIENPQRMNSEPARAYPRAGLPYSPTSSPNAGRTLLPLHDAVAAGNTSSSVSSIPTGLRTVRLLRDYGNQHPNHASGPPVGAWAGAVVWDDPVGQVARRPSWVASGAGRRARPASGSRSFALYLVTGFRGGRVLQISVPYLQNPDGDHQGFSLSHFSGVVGGLTGVQGGGGHG